MTLHCRKKPQIQKTHCSARGRLGRCHSPFSFLRCCCHVFCCYRGGCDAHLPQARPHRVCTRAAQGYPVSALPHAAKPPFSGHHTLRPAARRRPSPVSVPMLVLSGALTDGHMLSAEGRLAVGVICSSLLAGVAEHLGSLLLATQAPFL